MTADHRRFLAEKGLGRLLVGQISRDHFDRFLDHALVWSGDVPDIGTVNELVAVSASSRHR